MALTLLDYAQMMRDVVQERYAAYKGKRIPCASGGHAYHLTPAAADKCCGPGVRFILSVSGRDA